MEAASERAAEMGGGRSPSTTRSPAPGTRRRRARSRRGSAGEKLSAEERAALDSLAADLRSMDREAAEESERLAQELGQQGAKPDFEKTAESMERGDRESARPGAERLKERLSRLRQQVDKMRENWWKKNELAKKMEDAAQDLIEIGKLQQRMLGDQESSLSDRRDAEGAGGRDVVRHEAHRRDREADAARHADIGQALGRALTTSRTRSGAIRSRTWPAASCPGRRRRSR